MPQRSPWTPEDRRSIRSWSFVVAILYSTLLLTFLAVVSVAFGPTPPETDVMPPLTGQSWFATADTPG